MAAGQLIFDFSTTCEEVTKRCSSCRQSKPVSEFGKSRSRHDGLCCYCRPCQRRIGNRWRDAHRAEVQQRDREQKRLWREQHPEEDRERNRRWRKEHPEQARRNAVRQRRSWRGKVLDHYGRECACCGAVDWLVIDHIAGNGKEHRAKIGVSGSTSMYLWLISNGFPEGFQTLCFPCNSSKQKWDHCLLTHLGPSQSSRAAEARQMREAGRSIRAIARELHMAESTVKRLVASRALPSVLVKARQPLVRRR